MAKRFYTTTSSGEEVEVDSSLARQLIDAGKKKPEDFTVEDGFIQEEDQQTEDPSLVDAVFGKDTFTPLEVKDVVPTGMGVIDFTPQKRVNIGEKVFSGATNAIDVFRRGAGALLARPEGQTFMQGLADPNSGIFRKVRKAIDKSDNNEASKIVLTLGVNIVEDPLTFLSGAFSVANKIAKPGKMGKRLDVAKEIIPVSEELAKEFAPKAGLKGKPGRTTKMPVTPAEEVYVSTGNLPKKVGTIEAKARAQTPAAEVIKAERTQQRINELSNLSAKHGFDSIGKEQLTENIVKRFDTEMARFKSKASKIFDNIESSANPVPVQKRHYKNAKRNIINALELEPPKPGRKMTAEEIIKERPDVFDLPEGKRVELMKKLKEGTPEKFDLPRKEHMRVSKEVHNQISGLLDDLDNGQLSYKKIKNIRGSLDEITPSAANDVRYIKAVRKQVTEMMERHLGDIGGPELIKTFRDANELYTKSGSYKKLKNLFYNKEGTKVAPEYVLNKITSVRNKEASQILADIKDILDEDSFKVLSNAYWNKLIQEGTENGVVQGKKFVKILNRQDPTVFNYIFDDDIANDLWNIAKDATIDEMTVELGKRIDKLTPKGAIKIAKEKMGVVGRWAIMRSVARRAGIPTAIGAKIGAELIADGLRRSPTSASRYLRQIQTNKLKDFSLVAKEAINLAPGAATGARFIEKTREN